MKSYFVQRRATLAVATAIMIAVAAAPTSAQTVLSGTYTGPSSNSGNFSVNSSGTATFTNGYTFQATTNLTLGNYATLNWNQNATLAGTAVTFGTTPGYYASIYIGSANTLIIDSASSFTGYISLNGYSSSAFINNGTITNTSGTGTLYAPTLTNNGSITANSGSSLYIGDYYNAGATNGSTGTITATGTGTIVYLRNVLNQGGMTAASGGILEFQGAGAGNLTSNFGNVTLSTGGRALLNGTFDNSSHTLSSPTGGSYELYGGTINGGTIGAGALTFTSSGGTIAGATLTDPVTLAANTSVTLSNDTLTGGVSVGNNSTLTLTANTFFPGTTLAMGDYANLNWNQNGTLTGKTITSGVTPGYYAPIYIGSGYSLTLGSGTTLTGDVYLDGYSGSTFTNNGTITHTSGTGTLYAPTLTNNGSITANSGSSLYIGDYYNAGATNGSTGTITATGTGTIVYLRNVLNQGQMTASSGGILNFQGTGAGNLTSNFGNVTLSTGGRALLNGTFDNSSYTLTAPTGGFYELYGGTINGGTIGAGALTFTGSGGTVAGATLVDPVILPANTSVTLSNDTLTGNVSVGNSSTLTLTANTFFPGSTLAMGDYANLNWNQNGTLTGKTITSGVTPGYYAPIYIGSGYSLTLGSGTTLTGDVYLNGYSGSTLINNGTITHTSGTGTLYAPTLTNNGSVTANSGSSLYIGDYYNPGATNSSTGTITATGTGTIVYLRNVLNQGQMTASSGGILNFQGQGAGNLTSNFGNVTLSTGGRALLSGLFDNSSHTLAAPTGGTFELYGGTINGGTIGTGALTFTSNGGTIAGATLVDPVTLPASTNVTLSNDVLSGNLSLGYNSNLTLTANTTMPGSTLSLGDYANLNWNQNGTLTGKTITSGVTPGYYAPIYIGSGFSLTLGSGTTLTGDVYLNGYSGSTLVNNGTITQTSGTGTLYAPTLTNNGSVAANSGSSLYFGDYYNPGATNSSTGTITATGAGTIVYLRNVLNQGLMTASNSGVLEFQGQGAGNLTSNFGNVTLTSGGRALLNGTFDNSSHTLTAPTGGTYELYGGTINGGTIGTGALTFTNYGGTIAGATLVDPVTLPASTTVTLSNDSITGNITTGASSSLTLTGAPGTVVPNGVSLNLGDYAYLYWYQSGTLTGNTITSGVTAGYYAPIYVGSGYSLTLAGTTNLSGDVYLYGTSSSTITNNGTITHTSGSGSIYAPTFTNNGSITANGASNLTIGDYYNAGATNASTGVISATGSGTNIYLRNVLNQGTLNAQNGGALQFQGQGAGNTTANFGTVVLATGGQAFLSSGTFSNTLLTAPTGGIYQLYGATINGGTIGVNALTFTSSGGTLNGVTFAGDLTLPSSSNVTFTGGTTFNGANATIGNNAGIYWNQDSTLIGKTITSGNTPGTYGYISVGYNNTLTLASTTSLTGTIYLNGTTGSSVVNQGTITHVSGTGYLYVPTFTNSGLLDIQGGTLYGSTNFTNTTGGTLKGSGTIGGSMTFTGGTIAPGDITGNLTLYNGAFTVTGASVFSVNLGGITANELIFQSPTAPVNLGSGLLALSLNLLSAPSQGTTYPLINIAYGGSGITGTFAGLPSAGDGFSANYLGTPYLFTVNYGTNLISITAVPEPGTPVLLSLGVALLAAGRWRAKRRRN